MAELQSCLPGCITEQHTRRGIQYYAADSLTNWTWRHRTSATMYSMHMVNVSACALCAVLFWCTESKQFSASAILPNILKLYQTWYKWFLNYDIFYCSTGASQKNLNFKTKPDPDVGLHLKTWRQRFYKFFLTKKSNNEIIFNWNKNSVLVFGIGTGTFLKAVSGSLSLGRWDSQKKKYI